jgi:NhaA family Na+:H+ antiporter
MITQAQTSLDTARSRHAWRQMTRFVTDRFLLLPIGATIALVWANVHGESYFRFAHAMAFPVNEIGMALFVALVAQEAYEASMPGGALHTWRHWTTPVVAGAGAVVGSVLAYLGYVFWRQEELLWQAWPVAGAVDVAAGYYVLKLVFRRSNVIPFFLLLGFTANTVMLLVMAVWPRVTPGHVWGGLLLAGAVASAALLRRRRVRVFWPYFAVSGAIAWWSFYLAGVHPALALVPIVPFLPHEPRGLNLFADPPDDDAVHQAEHWWNEVVQVVAFLFGLANAGVLLRGYDTGAWAVLVAALVGRPLGILGAVGVGMAAGLHLPRGMGWRHLVTLSLAACSGFTFALFVATGLLPPGAILQQVKYGALLTVVGAPIALGVAWALRTGRFRNRPRTALRRPNGLSAEARPVGPA